MSQDRDYERLRRMRDFSYKAVELCRGRCRQDLDTDGVLTLALQRLLELIGEAARNISPVLRARHSEIPWSSVIGTRDRLAHGYMKISYNVVWAVITVDLPALIAQVEILLKNEFKDADR